MLLLRGRNYREIYTPTTPLPVNLVDERVVLQRCVTQKKEGIFTQRGFRVYITKVSSPKLFLKSRLRFHMHDVASRAMPLKSIFRLVVRLVIPLTR